MTSLDEALRALEKKWRRECDWPDGGDDFARGISKGLTIAADELAALLTTRQEVAPVAWQYRKPGGRWETVSKSTFDKYREGSGYEWRELFASTGQTSDARDVMAARIVAKYRLQPGWASLNDRAQMDKARGFVDAAMQQTREGK